MYRHGRTSAIDMYFGRAVLNGQVSDMPGKYYMRGTCDILDMDKIIHKNCIWFVYYFESLIKYTVL